MKRFFDKYLLIVSHPEREYDFTDLMCLLLVILMLSLPVFASPFADVPRTHWAWGAVADLASRGVLIGYPDGSFSGERTMTRYEMALVIARLMARTDELRLSGRGLSSTDYQTLQKLTLEFADELALVGVKVATLEDEVATVRDDMAVMQRGMDMAALTRSVPAIGVGEGISQVQPGLRMYAGTPAAGRFRVSGELLAQYLEQRFDSGAGAYDQPLVDDITRNMMRQKLRLFVDTPVDDHIAVHLALEYGWDNWGEAGGDFNSGLNIAEAYLHIDQFFGWAEKFRVGRQSYTHANDLLFNPTSMDAIYLSQPIHRRVDMSFFGAVGANEPANMGLNIYGLKGDIDLNDIRLRVYYVSRNDPANIHNPSGSIDPATGNLVTPDSPGSVEYGNDGQFEGKTYAGTYENNWNEARATRYLGFALNGHIFRDLAYYGELASMSWNSKMLDPAEEDGSSTLGPQVGMHLGLKWDVTDDLNARFRFRHHGRFFEPLTATRGVFANNLYTDTGFGEEWFTSWEALGYTRNFSNLLARLEYQMGDSAVVWGSMEWVNDNRKAEADEFKDNTAVLGGGLNYRYRRDVHLRLSWHHFNVKDAVEGAFAENNVGARDKTGVTPEQNLHIGQLGASDVQKDQHVLRMEVQVRF